MYDWLKSKKAEENMKRMQPKREPSLVQTPMSMRMGYTGSGNPNSMAGTIGTPRGPAAVHGGEMALQTPDASVVLDAQTTKKAFPDAGKMPQLAGGSFASGGAVVNPQPSTPAPTPPAPTPQLAGTASSSSSSGIPAAPTPAPAPTPVSAAKSLAGGVAGMNTNPSSPSPTPKASDSPAQQAIDSGLATQQNALNQKGSAIQLAGQAQVQTQDQANAQANTALGQKMAESNTPAGLAAFTKAVTGAQQEGTKQQTELNTTVSDLQNKQNVAQTLVSEGQQIKTADQNQAQTQYQNAVAAGDYDTAAKIYAEQNPGKTLDTTQFKTDQANHNATQALSLGNAQIAAAVTQAQTALANGDVAGYVKSMQTAYPALSGVSLTSAAQAQELQTGMAALSADSAAGMNPDQALAQLKTNPQYATMFNGMSDAQVSALYSSIHTNALDATMSTLTDSQAFKSLSPAEQQSVLAAQQDILTTPAGYQHLYSVTTSDGTTTAYASQSAATAAAQANGGKVVPSIVTNADATAALSKTGVPSGTKAGGYFVDNAGNLQQLGADGSSVSAIDKSAIQSDPFGDAAKTVISAGKGTLYNTAVDAQADSIIDSTGKVMDISKLANLSPTDPAYKEVIDRATPADLNSGSGTFGSTGDMLQFKADGSTIVGQVTSAPSKPVSTKLNLVGGGTVGGSGKNGVGSFYETTMKVPGGGTLMLANANSVDGANYYSTDGGATWTYGGDAQGQANLKAWNDDQNKMLTDRAIGQAALGAAVGGVPGAVAGALT